MIGITLAALINIYTLEPLMFFLICGEYCLTCKMQVVSSTFSYNHKVCVVNVSHLLAHTLAIITR